MSHKIVYAIGTLDAKQQVKIVEKITRSILPQVVAIILNEGHLIVNTVYDFVVQQCQVSMNNDHLKKILEAASD